MAAHVQPGNCEPRNKATLRPVKKESSNKGRLFWTCTTYPFCNFFLWREDALVRESGLAAPAPDVNLSRDEPTPPRPKTPTLTQKALESYGIQATPTPARRQELLRDTGGNSGSTGTLQDEPSPTMPITPSTPGSKRKRYQDSSPDSDDEFSELDSDEERQLAKIADESAQKATAACNTTSDIFTTPSTSRRATNIVAGLPTPSVSRTLFPPTSEARRSKAVSFDDAASPGAVSTPSKVGTAMEPHASVDDKQDTTEKVMSLLGNQSVDSSVLQSVRRLLNTESSKAKGAILGRDAAREALQKKDKKLAEQQDRIRYLENQETLLRKEISHMKAKLMRIYDDH